MDKAADYSSQKGCEEIADKIRNYWSKRGFYVSVRAVKQFVTASPSCDSHATWVVESDMVGGLPREARP